MEMAEIRITDALRREIIRIVDERIREVHVTREDFSELKSIVKELAEAQKRTEQRMEELAKAQKKTEECLRKLIEEHGETRRQLGGRSSTVGYYLEDRALKSLPSLLKDRYGITLTSRPVRRFLEDKKGRPVEVNIYAEGKRDGKEIYVIGESKAQLSIRHINDFLTKKIGSLTLHKEIFPVIVTYMIQDPKVEDCAREKGVALFYSYELEL